VQLQLDEAIRSLTEGGIHVVVAAGNEDTDACDSSPAREATAVTVGATTEGDARLWLSSGENLPIYCHNGIDGIHHKLTNYGPAPCNMLSTAAASFWWGAGKGSNYGECVDLFAPGTNILSASGSADDAQQ
jgi:subtilisin family serine protease